MLLAKSRLKVPSGCESVDCNRGDMFLKRRAGFIRFLVLRVPRIAHCFKDGGNEGEQFTCFCGVVGARHMGSAFGHFGKCGEFHAGILKLWQ
ncbi:hypothetical protein D3P06_12835 [Paracoccus aestuarii]|uniref:Uncharacterized protein n=1 Tax=Paracoccus aestuarii TaxID=453842 RepID=A0A418ZU57_9RHOB|nr:hypothetical protein D3P06_12835 [Paracoccus aestuarii]